MITDYTEKSLPVGRLKFIQAGIVRMRLLEIHFKND